MKSDSIIHMIVFAKFLSDLKCFTKIVVLMGEDVSAQRLK